MLVEFNTIVKNCEFTSNQNVIATSVSVLTLRYAIPNSTKTKMEFL